MTDTRESIRKREYGLEDYDLFMFLEGLDDISAEEWLQAVFRNRDRIGANTRNH